MKFSYQTCLNRKVTLRNVKDFFDVTLACEDGRIQADNQVMLVQSSLPNSFAKKEVYRNDKY